MEPRLFPDDPPPKASAPEAQFTIDPAERPYRPFVDPLAKTSGRGFWPFGSVAVEGMALGRWHSGIVRLLIAVAVLGGSAGALWLTYTKGRQAALSGDVPLIRADPTAMKVKPANPGGMQDDTNDAIAYQPATGAGNVENLLAPPEQPLPKPAPDANAIAAPVPVPPPVQPAATAPAAPPPVTVAAPAPAPQAAAPAPAPTAQASAAPGGAFRVQIAATRDAPTAHREWLRMQHAHAALLGGLSADVVRVDLGTKGVFYRVQAGPLADHGAAERLCAELKQVSIGCIIVKH